MEMGEVAKNNNNNRVGGEGECRANPEKKPTTHSTDSVLQWGNRKRLRCMKIRTRVGVVDRTTDSSNNRHFSSPPPLPHRISRKSEACGAMKVQSNGGSVVACFSPDQRRGEDDHDKKKDGGGSASSETAQDSKRGGGGGSSSGSEAMAIWLPKFVIALTNKEKEEDFMAIKGSKLPQRPKKRAKFVQRTLNFVSPGSLLCDLTLERYEVREKKILKKRPRGLKAMGNVESDSE